MRPAGRARGLSGGALGASGLVSPGQAVGASLRRTVDAAAANVCSELSGSVMGAPTRRVANHRRGASGFAPPRRLAAPPPMLCVRSRQMEIGTPGTAGFAGSRAQIVIDVEEEPGGDRREARQVADAVLQPVPGDESRRPLGPPGRAPC